MLRIARIASHRRSHCVALRYLNTYTEAQLRLEKAASLYREHGHALASFNPLVNDESAADALRAQARAALGDTDVLADHDVAALGEHGAALAPGDAIEQLERVYCGSVGVELTHLSDEEQRWVCGELERGALSTAADDAELVRHYELMMRSQVFDHFVHKKMRMVKRYGLEGVEGMMVAMDELFRAAAAERVPSVTIGMPHRGRLNLLEGLLRYPARFLFHKMRGFSLLPEGTLGTDDVLSHISQSVDLAAEYGADGPLRVSLLHNPSHLEAANPVAMGKTRSKQDAAAAAAGSSGGTGGDGSTDEVAARRGQGLCVLMHGDAAFAGQGVVAESLLLANLPGYTTGGSVHVIVNNQLGFTTPSAEGRSSRYASDVAKTVGALVMHVNAEDSAAVARASAFAVRFRNRFARDAVVDLVGYRRHGHNELDDPSFTQPAMYKHIRERATVPNALGERLAAAGVLDAERQRALQARYENALDEEFKACMSNDEQQMRMPANTHLTDRWAAFTQGTTAAMVAQPATGVPEERLRAIAAVSVDVSGIELHPRLRKGFAEARQRRLDDEGTVDWATAEALAFGSLLAEGHHVRLAGQDVQRGTFSHRHAMLVCQQSERRHVPLNAVAPAPGVARAGRLRVVNSPLSEFACMGFEYGYSIDDPFTLCVWEAQFGDFANTAQVIIDTFVASGEDKWLRQSGLVLSLPHGYDGAGPEHSSSRIERYLQLSSAAYRGDEARAPAHTTNWSVINPTTPANYFHALRRQQLRAFRKPLVIAAAKTLLRLPQCVSELAELSDGTSFHSVLDVGNPAADAVGMVIFCSGKVYYELVRERAERGFAETFALVRLEELSPFPFEAVEAVLQKYENAVAYRFVQEEPRNQGAWSYVVSRFNLEYREKYGPLQYIGQPALSSPATGIKKEHDRLQAQMLLDAFELP